MLITKLRPLIVICQIYGLIPFSMEMDPITGEFQRFTFSLKKAVAWWYVVVFIFQVTCYLITVVSRGKNETEAENLEVTGIIWGLTIANQIMYMAQISFSRFVVLKFKRFRRIIAWIHEVEKDLSEVVLNNSGDSIVLRAILGILFATVMVIHKIIVLHTYKSYLFRFLYDKL